MMIKVIHKRGIGVDFQKSFDSFQRAATRCRSATVLSDCEREDFPIPKEWEAAQTMETTETFSPPSKPIQKAKQAKRRDVKVWFHEWEQQRS